MTKCVPVIAGGNDELVDLYCRKHGGVLTGMPSFLLTEAQAAWDKHLSSVMKKKRCPHAMPGTNSCGMNNLHCYYPSCLKE
jgi:hypothetical protein